MERFQIDLLQYKVFDKLDFALQIRFRQVCKWFFRLEIHDFLNIDKKYVNRFSNKILMHYPSIKYLNASYNSGIDDNGIKHLNLIELNAYNNRKITDVNHLTKLQTLDASYRCGIDDKGIKDLNLVELITTCNYKITTKI